MGDHPDWDEVKTLLKEHADGCSAVLSGKFVRVPSFWVMVGSIGTILVIAVTAVAAYYSTTNSTREIALTALSHNAQQDSAIVKLQKYVYKENTAVDTLLAELRSFRREITSITTAR